MGGCLYCVKCLGGCVYCTPAHLAMSMKFSPPANDVHFKLEGLPMTRLLNMYFVSFVQNTRTSECVFRVFCAEY